MIKMLDDLYEKGTIEKEPLVDLLDALDHYDEQGLYSRLQSCADAVRRKHYGQSVFVRGLIEFSNRCVQNCLYCGLRKGNQRVQRYRLSQEEVIECCCTGYSLGYRTFVLQSGEDPWYTQDKMVEIIGGIRKICPDAAITLSIGERSMAEYRKFFEAGADRYLLRHETASRDLYEKLHPFMSYEARCEHLNMLKRIGFQTGAGFMVGLPDQTNHHLADDLLFLKKLNPEMIGIGPFLPHSDTPLGNRRRGTIEKTIMMVALARLLVPDALIPATTAMETLDPKGKEKALRSGANVLMTNLSPEEVRPKYALYENKLYTDEAPECCKQYTEDQIRNAGYKIDMGRGDSLKMVNGMME